MRSWPRPTPTRPCRDAGSAAEERITKWREALPFREDLYRSVSAVAPRLDEALTDEQRHVLELWMRDFRRAGQALSRPRIAPSWRRIRARLVELEIAFNRNVNEFEDGIDVTAAQLDGLPDEYVDRLIPGQRRGHLPGQPRLPGALPVPAQASDRARRGRRCSTSTGAGAVTENRPLLVEALRLRQRAAELLGLPDLGALRASR